MGELERQIAQQVFSLRRARGWSLDHLAQITDVSRATLSRIENAEVSPTAATLQRICAAFDLSLSRFWMQVEDRFAPLIPLEDQQETTDAPTGASWRGVSPPSSQLSASIQDLHVPPATVLPFGLHAREHHIVVLDGAVKLGLGDDSYSLAAGDCLRVLDAPDCAFETDAARGVRCLIVTV